MTQTVPQAEEIEALMERAAQAAREGRWAQVAACYQQRAKLVEAGPLTQARAEAVLELDRQIFERVRAAHAVLGHRLRDVADHRRRLDQMHQLLRRFAAKIGGAVIDRRI